MAYTGERTLSSAALKPRTSSDVRTTPGENPRICRPEIDLRDAREVYVRARWVRARSRAAHLARETATYAWPSAKQPARSTMTCSSDAPCALCIVIAHASESGTWRGRRASRRVRGGGRTRGAELQCAWEDYGGRADLLAHALTLEVDRLFEELWRDELGAPVEEADDRPQRRRRSRLGALARPAIARASWRRGGW